MTVEQRAEAYLEALGALRLEVQIAALDPRMPTDLAERLQAARKAADEAVRAAQATSEVTR